MTDEQMKALAQVKELLGEVNKLIRDNNLGSAIGIEETYDVTDLFVCVYNTNQVGLFTRKKVNTPYILCFSHYEWETWLVYEGFKNPYVGLKRIHSYSSEVNYWEEIGAIAEGKKYYYTATCNMSNGMSFDDMRLIMNSKGEIGTYKIGVATESDLIKVLAFARQYYNLDQKQVKVRR